MHESLVNAFRYHRHGKRTGVAHAVPASRAIELARLDVANGKTRYESSARDSGYGPVFQASGATAMRFVEKPSAAGLRFVGYAGKLARLDHNGWYIDNDQNETLQGVVFQLPGRDGKPLFVAGYDEPCNGAADSDGPVCLDFGDIFEGDASESDNPANLSAAIDAAGIADQLAEWMAEYEREYQAAACAGFRYGELGETIEAERKRVLMLLDDRKRARALGDAAKFPTICATIRERVAESLERIAEARRERGKLASGDYCSEWLPGFSIFDRRLCDAFNESAGKAVL